MAKCKLKKGFRIYECRYHEATLTELTTDPELTVQEDGSHYWHWRARIVATGEIVEFGITEESPQYGPRLFRKNMYEVGYKNAEPLLPPFNTTEDVEVRKVSINDDLFILGHVFHGLKDIQEHVEMSLYKDYSHERARQLDPIASCDVHVGEMWYPYPCFDSSDFASENRSYQNFIFRAQSITQDDMKMLSELPNQGNQCRISEVVPSVMLPMVYYVGDGSTMLVALDI